MSNKIVQLENEAGDNIYPLAGGALTGSISKTMLEEGVFEGPELSEPSTVAYVATDNIQDGAVTSDKIDWTTMSSSVITVTKNSTYVGNVESSNVRRTGNLIEFAFVFTLAADVTVSGQTLFSGLPAPKVGVHQFTGISLLNDQLPIRVAINSAGDFKAWYNTASYLANGRTIVVSGAYFTD